MPEAARRARLEEFPAVLALWLEMLKENHAVGGEILPSGHNLDVYARVMRGYVLGQAPGAVVVVDLTEDPARLAGVLCWGEGGEQPFETTFGRSAMGWGTYVIPEARGRGLSTILRREGRRLLRELGFDSVVGGAVDANEAGIESGLRSGGARRHGVIGVIDLREGA